MRRTVDERTQLEEQWMRRTVDERTQLEEQWMRRTTGGTVDERNN